MASLEPSAIDFEQERHRGGDRRIEVFTDARLDVTW
jgi:hypothetical protein